MTRAAAAFARRTASAGKVRDEQETQRHHRAADRAQGHHLSCEMFMWLEGEQRFGNVRGRVPKISAACDALYEGARRSAGRVRMSHTSYTNAACDLICRIRDFPLEKLREEIDEKRAKLRALGWPEPDLTLENKLNDYLAEVRALRYQTFDVGTARSGRRNTSEAE